MQINQPTRVCPALGNALLLSTLLGIAPGVVMANAGEEQPILFAVEEVELDLVEVDQALDLTFTDDGEVFVLRPQRNAMTKVVYDGITVGYTTWMDEYALPDFGFDTLCSMRPAQQQTFCWECLCDVNDQKNGCPDSNSGGNSIYVPMTTGVSLDFAGGSLLVGQGQGPLGLFTTDMELWYACGEPVGTGLPQDIAEYGVSYGAAGSFSLAYPESQGGLMPSFGLVVGGVNPNDPNGPKLSSRKGSGSGGGGPYPGVDSAWTANNAGATSLSASTAKGDFNGDGWEDLVVLHPDDGTVGVLLFESLSTPTDQDNNPVPGGAVFGTPLVFTPGVAEPRLAAAGHLNDDGLLDLAIAGSDNLVAFHYGDGAGGFTNSETAPLPFAPSAMESVDIDGEGPDEILVAGGRPDLTGWLRVCRLIEEEEEVAIGYQGFEFDGAISALAVNKGPGPAIAAVTKVSDDTLRDRITWIDGGTVVTYEDLGEIIDLDVNFTTIAFAESDGAVRTFQATDLSTLEICIPAGAHQPVSVACGSTFTIAAYSNGAVLGCGTSPFDAHVIPEDLGSVTMVAASQTHAMALQSDGTVRCWGNNGDGQCNVPIGLSDVIAISASGHSVALKSDGTVVCWGLNWAGQCDPPPGLQDVVEISAGFAHTVARRSDGTVVCWGEYACTGTPDDLADVVEVDTADLVNIVRFADGSIACYGDGSPCEAPVGIGAVREMSGGIYGFAILDQAPDASTVSLLEISLDQQVFGDLNGDAMVNGADLGLMLAAWGTCSGDCPADLNGNGVVDGADLGLMLSAWTG